MIYALTRNKYFLTRAERSEEIADANTWWIRLLGFAIANGFVGFFIVGILRGK